MAAKPRGPRKGARGGKRVRDTRPVAKRLVPPIFSVPEGRIAQAGLLIVDRREKPVPFRRLETRE